MDRYSNSDRKRFLSLDMRELLQFFLDTDPAFGAVAVGTSAKKILELEKITSVPLPADYRIFLSMVGKNTGNLFRHSFKLVEESSSQTIYQNISFDIKHAVSLTLRHKREDRRQGQAPLFKNDGAALLCLGALDIYQDLTTIFYMDCSSSNPPVMAYQTEYEKLCFNTRVCDNFLTFVARFAFSDNPTLVYGLKPDHQLKNSSHDLKSNKLTK